jgi:hypothetical protein
MIEQVGFFPELEFYFGNSIESIENYSNNKFKSSDAKVTFKFYFWKEI